MLARSCFHVPACVHPRRIATLWELSLGADSVSCSVYRDGGRMELRLESAANVLVTEPFDLRPRMMARARALRESLKRRGWEEPASGGPNA
jgi:hypothetical protein